MKKLVLALLLILLQLCTACSETTYHSNEEIGRAFQRHKSTFENVAVSAVGENSGYIHKPDAEGQETECGDSGCKLMEADGLHIHLQREMSDTELRHIAEAALAWKTLILNPSPSRRRQFDSISKMKVSIHGTRPLCTGGRTMQTRGKSVTAKLSAVWWITGMLH